MSVLEADEGYDASRSLQPHMFHQLTSQNLLKDFDKLKMPRPYCDVCYNCIGYGWNTGEELKLKEIDDDVNIIINQEWLGRGRMFPEF